MSNRGREKGRKTVKIVLLAMFVFHFLGNSFLKERKFDFLIPESISCEIALTPTSGLQFDKSPSRGVKGAHEGDAHAEYH